MNIFYLTVFFIFNTIAADNSPFEVRVVEPRLKIEDIKGSSQKEKEVSSFELQVLDVVKVKLDLELLNVTHQYEIGGIEWKASTLVINNILCNTEAHQVKVTNVNVDVNAPFVRGLKIRRPVTKNKHEKEAKKIKIVSKLREPIEIPLPAQMEVLLSWEKNKPVIRWPNPQAIKDQFLAVARERILQALDSSVSFSSNLPEEKEFKEGFAAYQKQLKQLLGDKVKISFDRLAILKSIMESILLQLAPSLQLAANGQELPLLLEVRNKTLFITPKGQTYVETPELKDWLVKKQDTLINKVNVFMDSTLFNRNLVSMVPETKLLPRFNSISIQPWLEPSQNKQYFDLSLTDEKNKNSFISFEVMEKGLPKLLNNKENLQEWLIGSFVDQTLKAQNQKILSSGLEFEGFSFIASNQAFRTGVKAQTVILQVAIK